MQTRTDTVMSGSLIGGYRIVCQIGAGGMGAVFLAEHVKLGRRAALKVLHPQFSSRPEIVARFFNEARAATAISDPGIVQIFDFGHHTDGSAYIVMELLEGEPLDQRLQRNGPFALTAALRIMRQVASSLGAAHARGIVHRDLKPENIFIVRDAEVLGGERAKILDFGIAKLTGDNVGIKTQTSAIMGTPTYMSPEQCRGAGEVDQRSDVYALGCVLYSLLTGRPPFDAEGVGEIIAMHLREAPPAPSMLRSSIPAPADQLVLRCLSKDPAQRYMSGADLAIAIGVLLGSSPEIGSDTISSAVLAIASAPTTLSAASGQSGATTTHRSRALIGGVIVAAVGGIAAFLALHSHRAPAPTIVAAIAAPMVVVDAPIAADAADPNTRMKEVLAVFASWSRDHGGAACPDPVTLGGAVDAWGHPFRITCIDQPSDQIIGVISDGSDGTANTADDVASWRLGRDVTKLVDGPRWGSAPAKPIKVVAKPHPIKLTPVPAAPVKPTIQLDDNGIPVSR
jgi:serine/threonine-protein kinase